MGVMPEHNYYTVQLLAYRGYHAVGGNDTVLFLDVMRALLNLDSVVAGYEMGKLLKYACKVDHVECVATALQYCAAYGNTASLERVLMESAIEHASKRTIQLLTFVKASGVSEAQQTTKQKRSRDCENELNSLF